MTRKQTGWVTHDLLLLILAQVYVRVGQSGELLVPLVLDVEALQGSVSIVLDISLLGHVAGGGGSTLTKVLGGSGVSRLFLYLSISFSRRI